MPYTPLDPLVEEGFLPFHFRLIEPQLEIEGFIVAQTTLPPKAPETRRSGKH